jgi:hypothetical protein
MTDGDNPYQAPKTVIVEPLVAEPRPFLLFLTAASCWGAGVLFLLLTIAVVRHFVLTCVDQGWQWFVTHRAGPWMLLFDFLAVFCMASFMAAGRSFFVRSNRRGRRFLLAAVVGVVLLMAVAQFAPG